MATYSKDSANSGLLHDVAIVLSEGTVPLDLVVPLQVFDAWPPHMTTDLGMTNPYRVTMVGAADVSCGRWLVVQDLAPLERLACAQTVLVPGVMNPITPVDPLLVEALRAAYERGARMVSICTGAFALAAAGVLDGREATTHWYWTDALRQRHPRVRVRGSELYVTDGTVSTSAGVLAGTDLCLHLLRTDCGQEVSNAMARFLVSAPHREGGQAQFIDTRHEDDGTTLSRTMEWMLRHLDEPLTLESVSRQFHVSSRTLRRRFAAATGTTVVSWLIARRVDRARELLETTDLAVVDIANACGFGSAESLRLHFLKHVQTSPAKYRRTFSQRPQAGL